MDPTDPLLERLRPLAERHAELARHLTQSEIIADREQFQTLSQEWARLDPVVREGAELARLLHEREETELLIRSAPDRDLGTLAREEQSRLDALIDACRLHLAELTAPRDPVESLSCFLEIRAGTGGLEAALFAGSLFRMYSRYAEHRGWTVDALSQHPGEQGGYKEIIARMTGSGTYAALRYEGGTHRVQRVPKTESQGRIHTSTATVAVLPEAPEGPGRIEIPSQDLRVDTFRASGAGGQHVNKTESAVRLTHLPTGLAVECQDERSQHKNRARALSLLTARLAALRQAEEDRQVHARRRDMIGSGERAERIRTYNFPQNRVTDHRIGLSLYSLDAFLEGDLTPLITALQAAQVQGASSTGGRSSG
jgi:peptide chain release factor 1